MAASAAKTTGSGAVQAKNLPVKRTLNLAGKKADSLNLKIAIPAILLILAAAALFGKFAVADRLASVSQAKNEAAAVKNELTAAYEKLAGYGDLQDLYAHYTYSGMTTEELERADRAQVVRLIRDTVLDRAVIDSWSVSGNLLTISFTEKSLEEVNEVVKLIESDEIVDFCTVSTATTGNSSSAGGRTDEAAGVTARVIVYLKTQGGKEP